jgi:hypothetical protein
LPGAGTGPGPVPAPGKETGKDGGTKK